MVSGSRIANVQIWVDLGRAEWPYTTKIKSIGKREKEKGREGETRERGAGERDATANI